MKKRKTPYTTSSGDGAGGRTINQPMDAVRWAAATEILEDSGLSAREFRAWLDAEHYPLVEDENGNLEIGVRLDDVNKYVGMRMRFGNGGGK